MSGLTGKTIGQYEIGAEIGEGGMAKVYKAYQPSVDRHVAIKVLSGRFASDPNFVKRFHREAKAIARLEHPHILPLHDFGTADEQTFMVMRYVEGGTLANLVGKPISFRRVVEIIASIADALDYAHRQGVIHRDIKPNNILIDNHGQALLADFGIAKMTKDSLMTETESIVGTLAYIAPEQARGHIDNRSDIYSLGLVLYELLTGQSLAGSTKDLVDLLMHTIKPPPPPHTINPIIPEPLERVVLKAIELHPEQRYQTAGAMADALKQALVEAEKGPLSPPPAAPPRAAPGMAPLLVGAGLLLLLLCLAGAGLMTWLMVRPGPTATPVLSETSAAGLPTSQSRQTEMPAKAGETPLVASPVPTSTVDATAVTIKGETIPIAENGPVLFAERFDTNDNNWFTGPDNDEMSQGRAEIVNGRYRLSHTAKQGVFIWEELKKQTFDDFSLSVDVYPTQQDAAFAYGVIFRASDNGFYSFEVDTDGFFLVRLYQNDEWQTLVNFTEMAAIQPDHNQLRVTAVGSSLSFYVNDTEAATLNDATFTDGAVGLALDLYGEGDSATVDFDNLIIRQAVQGERLAETNKILLAETFDSDSNGWATGRFEDEYDRDEGLIKDGRFLFTVDSKKPMVYVEKTLPNREFSDFSLTVEATPQDSETYYSYGIAFRKNKKFHTYAFEIGNDGLYGVLLYDGEWHRLKDWSQTPAIRVGETNQLQVVAVGHTLSFFVNGQALTTLQDETLSAGNISLVVNMFEENRTATVHFDNLIVRSAGAE